MADKRKRRLHGTVTASSPLEQVLAKALSHPLRAEILSFLTEHGASSPAQMDKAGLGRGISAPNGAEKTKLGNIAYHCRVLEAMFPGWTVAQLFEPHEGPIDFVPELFARGALLFGQLR